MPLGIQVPTGSFQFWSSFNMSSSKSSALEKKRSNSSTVPAKKKAPKSRNKTVDLKLQEPTEEEKKARVIAAFSTPPEEALKTFRRASKEKKKAAALLKTKRASTADFLAKPASRGKKYSMDLRIHTPGTIGYFVSGGINPGPALTRLAKVKGLDIIGLTDFYDAGLIDKVGPQPKNGNLSILPGLDFRCQLSGCNEVFLIALFPENTDSATLFSVLQELEIPASARGKKSYVTQASVGAVIEAVESNGGVVIPSRVDKTPFRQLSIPSLVEEFGFRVFDLIHPESIEFFKERWPSGGFTFLSFSNADALAQMGTRVASTKLASGDFNGIKELVKRRG